jgi:DNA-binding FadR family transcriptional regulator
MTTDPPALPRAGWDPPTADRHRSRAQSAAEQLATMVAAAESGERLGTKEELRTLCGVSVGSFNEALRVTQLRGIITVRCGPGGGVFASRQSPMVRLGNSVLALDEDAALVADSIRLREALEPLLVQDSLQHASRSDIAALNAILEQMKAAADQEDAIAFLRANWALHARIAEITPSAILRSLYMSLLDLIESHMLAVLPVEGESLPEFIKQRYQLHADLVGAIAEGHPRALDIIREHDANAGVSRPLSTTVPASVGRSNSSS